MFINLTMNENERNQRLIERHEGDEQIVKLMEVGIYFKKKGNRFSKYFSRSSELT